MGSFYHAYYIPESSSSFLLSLIEPIKDYVGSQLRESIKIGEIINAHDGYKHRKSKNRAVLGS